MTPNPLSVIMRPRSIVVAGASNNIMKMGAMHALNLLYGGFQGDLLFLHPTEKNILGRQAYAAAAELPFVPDLALLVTPTRVTPGLMDDLGARGVRHAIVVTAGFREMGQAGAQLETELLAAAARHGVRFVGPNCIGVLNTHIGFNCTVIPYTDKPGRVGLISQSGTYVAQTIPYLREIGVRYSQAISVGNAANIDMVDCLEHFADDPDTHAIAMYIEGVRDGRRFLAAARRIAPHKPIVALYVGGSASGARSSLSHTGSLGRPDALMDGIFAQAGIVRASTVDEMFGWANVLANMPAPKGRRVAVLTHSGGPATSMADTIERTGLEMLEFSPALQAKIRPFIAPTASAKNPVDLTFDMGSEGFTKRIPEVIFGSEEVDALLIHGMFDTGFALEVHKLVGPSSGMAEEDFVKPFVFDLEPLLKMPGHFGKPLVASNFLRVDHAAETFRDRGVPLFRTPEAAVRGLAALVRYGQMSAAAEPDASVEMVTFPNGPRLSPGVITEYDAKCLLASHGVPTAKERLVGALDDALAAAAEIGFPVALKGLPEGVAHKTEAGLVHLKLRNKADLKAAWKKIEKAAPGCPRLVAEMLDGARELVVGMTVFAGFGPCVMLGVGGLFTETIRDVAFRAAPVSHADALSMLESLRLKKLYGPVRGLPAVDAELLARIIQAVGKLALAQPEITEIDINPLIVVDGRPIAADALIVVE